MADWNQQGAPNNNLQPGTIQTSKLIGANHRKNAEFSEERSDRGTQDEIIAKQLKKHQPGMG